MKAKPNPFRLGLKALSRPSPKRIYRFRRRVKRLQAYLALYTFPAEPPISEALLTLYRAAGKLRQAHLIQKALKPYGPPWYKLAKKRRKKWLRRFRKVWKATYKATRADLRRWAESFPPPWKSGLRMRRFWHQQVQNWGEAQKRRILALPEVPTTPEMLHQLRQALRRWELAGKWAELPLMPPAALTQLLGEARDLYLLLRWLRKKGASEDFLQPIVAAQQEKQAQALELWQSWRSSLS
ncbi:MAG: hypothetical protein NZ958_05510 [Bacteroidia bacterium]|nr:hypothetical protein [Bacteroidia bacterium]MDW8088963.1 CHAD domain-containing protein [Bacteroidia bacterium]